MIIILIVQFKNIRGSQVVLLQAQFDPLTGSAVTVSVYPNWHLSDPGDEHNGTQSKIIFVPSNLQLHLEKQLFVMKVSPMA